MPLKNRIRHWRLQLGISDQQEFADLIGFSVWVLERWERQKLQPTLEALCRIKEKLICCCPDLTLDDLVDFIQEEKTVPDSRSRNCLAGKGTVKI